ncbi:hypothetical protein Y032_0023g657 [Ancylostoma ceylanicum]|uniref:Uncharacterized protein n=1 Tax=Ancylostoma ceylanicum TaxID=53326 RepID=A0A016UY19_9BILA|nr:hypothetical protein Y032_0023g657 [Ancylostoma ceylanicum]
MTQQINYTALNDFLDNQTDDISSIYLWYEKLSEYDLEGNESPAELETIFHAMKFLMSFSFTAAEELREVAEREAVAMAEKEEAWEEQKIALKEELDTLRERITVSAEAGDSTEAFRAQIDSLREENRELEKTNRDRDREMADLRDRFESLVSRADVLTRERDALEQHRNQMEDTIRELQRRISAKSEETTNEWESRKLRQRNEQAVTLTRQMQAVVLQNDELREEVTRVGDALEEATRIINESSARYAELTAQHDAARRDLRALSEENAIMREKLDASSSMLATVESEAMDVEQSTAAKLREMSETNRELREELYATQRELDKLRQLTESMNNEEKEAELEKLRNELIEATKTARSLYGELTSKTSTDPTVAFQLRIMQLESHLEQSNEKIAAQKKALQELEETLVNKDKLHGEIAAELERLRELKFGDAREELKRLTTQLTFRDEQIARLTNHCTLLQVELGTYAERSLKPQTRDASVTSKVQETQTNGVRPDVVPQSEDRPRPQQVERKPRRSSKHRDATEVNVAREAQENQSEVRVRRVFDQDIWEQQAMLMVSLYSELMQIMEEQEVKQKQMAEMEEMLFKGRRAMDDAKSQLHSAFDEIYRLKKNDAAPADTESEEKMVELLELRRFASTIKAGGSEVERRAEEITRKLITEQIERVRLSRMNTVLRRRCNRVEQAMRRARERMVVVETQAGKRCAQLQYQLDTALIDLANCQNQLVRSVSIETYEKLALRFKKECVSDVLGSEIDEVARENTISIAPPTDAKTQELEAKNTYLKKIVDVISEQNDFWSKETEILQNENEELKRFVEDMENESDLKNILASIQQRLLETIREQQEGRRDHERAYRKAREAEEKLAQGRSEWSAQRSRFVFAIRTLQSALSNARLNSLGGLSLIQIEQLRTKVQEVRENEMVLKETKEQVEDLRDELQQKLAVQKAGRKAKDAVAEENADVSKLERRLQAVYSSLTLQTVEAERLKNAVQLKDNQLSDLKKELSAIEKENEDLMIAIASANLSSKPIKGMDVTEDEDKATMEENTTTTIENSAASPFLEEPQSSSEESEATSTDSERGGVKTVLQDNSKEFEKRLAKMKEAAELCIQGYKKQLLQKDQALEMYRQLAEEKLSSRPQPTVEKEIVREEVRVVDEQTEERLRQALGDVARLKEEIEELEKANRALYRKRRRSMVPVVNAVECQTDPIAEQETDAKETEAKTKTSPKNSPAGGSISSNAENKVEVERRRYKSEIKQLQGKLQRVVANNKELILACEKIREDAMAELEARAPRTSEADEKTMLRMRMELEKTKKENRSLRKTIEDQRTSLESFKKEIVQKKSGEDELARWNERKRLEENLSTVRKNLAESLEREKKTREKLSKRERLLEELRKDEELRQRELERTRRKNAELQYERVSWLGSLYFNHRNRIRFMEDRQKFQAYD